MTDISRIDVADSHGERVVSQPTVYVYEAPVPLWHWGHALAILVLTVPVSRIRTPPPTVPGEEPPPVLH